MMTGHIIMHFLFVVMGAITFGILIASFWKFPKVNAYLTAGFLILCVILPFPEGTEWYLRTLCVVTGVFILVSQSQPLEALLPLMRWLKKTKVAEDAIYNSSIVSNRSILASSALTEREVSKLVEGTPEDKFIASLSPLVSIEGLRQLACDDNIIIANTALSHVKLPVGLKNRLILERRFDYTNREDQEAMMQNPYITEDLIRKINDAPHSFTTETLTYMHLNTPQDIKEEILDRAYPEVMENLLAYSDDINRLASAILEGKVTERILTVILKNPNFDLSLLEEKLDFRVYRDLIVESLITLNSDNELPEHINQWGAAKFPTAAYILNTPNG